ncbi:F-box/WD repeat-containing protein 7-like isoform X2 [Hydractinia symbiolongicarpus]|uniref:F-box/WD repeat-containing protein 7-like isoform X2 n=1 Tax=Hydractinia symbiolongicarpus TaxID=13093 RepID=UPI00254B9B57|nr:F-box/WD repeat-containing protein 7-like isoform X2 [Hydractinia symbiolongicarpus]
MASRRQSQDDLDLHKPKNRTEYGIGSFFESKVNNVGSLPCLPSRFKTLNCNQTQLFHNSKNKNLEMSNLLQADELCIIATEIHSKIHSCSSYPNVEGSKVQQYHSWPKQKFKLKKVTRMAYHNFGLDSDADGSSVNDKSKEICTKDTNQYNMDNIVKVNPMSEESDDCIKSIEDNRKSEFELVYEAMVENLQQIDNALKISETNYTTKNECSFQTSSASKNSFQSYSLNNSDTDRRLQNHFPTFSSTRIILSDVAENVTSSSCEDSDSDSGVGQYSDFNPFLYSSNGINPPLFKKRKDLMMQWFASFSNEQKNIFIQQLVTSCGLPQMHLLSLKMEPILHKDCPENCRDMLRWLPENVVYHILKYLDPVSLSNASKVNRTWYCYSHHGTLWQRFCSYHQFSLSSVRHYEQIKKHTASDGKIQWKSIFVERYLCKKNWREGQCKVKTFVGHTQGVSCVQFDNKRIVSGSSDKTIRVWDLTSNSNKPVLTLVGHFGTVRCLQLNGNQVISGSADATIKVWDLSVGSDWNMAACRVTMVGHLDTVRCLQVDAEKVISGSYDNTLKVWDLKTGRCKLTLRGHSAGVLCVQFDDQKIVSGSSDNTIKVWNLLNGVCLATLRGHTDAVTCLQFNQNRIISGSLDCTLKFWDINSGQCIGTIDWIRSEGHTRVVRCLQADNWKIVSAGDDKTLKIWSLKTGERFVTLHKHTDGVTCLQFDDVMIVSGSYDKTVKVWNFLP